jgi:hypothetical protein
MDNISLKRGLTIEEWEFITETKRRKLEQTFFPEPNSSPKENPWDCAHRLDDIQWERFNQMNRFFGDVPYPDNPEYRWVFLNKNSGMFQMPNHGVNYDYDIFDDGYCKRFHK